MHNFCNYLQKADPNFLPPLSVGCTLVLTKRIWQKQPCANPEHGSLKALRPPPYPLRSLSFRKLAVTLWRHSSSHIEKTVWQETGLQPRRATGISHLESRPPSPQPDLQMTAALVTSWVTLSQNHQQGHSWIPNPQKRCEIICICVCYVLGWFISQ